MESEVEVPSWRADALDLDRRKEFVVDDAPNLGPEVFFASKAFNGVGTRTGSNRVTAIAVREHETGKYAKVLRFMYNVPGALQNSLKTWIAMPKSNASLRSKLFSGK